MDYNGNCSSDFRGKSGEKIKRFVTMKVLNN